MKVTDYISQRIQTWPTLYKAADYETSKLRVLDHVFFTGDSDSLAYTEKPEEGGYIVGYPDQKYKNTKDERVRKYDKPYGKIKYKPIPEGYFDTIIYSVHSPRFLLETIVHNEEGTHVYYRYDKRVHDRYGFVRPALVCEVDGVDFSFTPYPFNEGGYCLASAILKNNLFLQPDWMEALVFLCEKTLEYFHDENRYKENTYYHSQGMCEYTLQELTRKLTEGGEEALKKDQEAWGFKVTGILPTMEEILEKKTERWNLFKQGQIAFLNRVIAAYKNKHESFSI